MNGDHLMAAWYGGQGSQWTRRQVPVPEPGPEQVLLRTRAAALNNADAGMARDGDPFLAGFEVCGDVIARGPAVHDIAVGTRVAGTTPGTFAEYVAIDHRWVMPVPGQLEATAAAALPTALLTEHGALRLADFAAGDTVLITGATSSIGLVGVQIAKVLGAAAVIATTRSETKKQLLFSVGADAVVTDVDGLASAVRDATGGQGAAVVLDHVGGRTFAACLDAAQAGGRIVNVGRLDQSRSTIDLDTLAARGLILRGVSFGFSDPDKLGAIIRAAADALNPAVAAGQVRPVIDRIVQFDRANEALDALRSGATQGKVVLSLG